MDQVLITIEEVRNYGRQIADSTDKYKFETFVREAQRNFLEPLIGSPLYIDLLNNTSSVNSGSLILNRKYNITNYKTPDDFKNVGASENKFGISFIASETTPTDWNAKSILQTSTDNYFDLLNGIIYDNKQNVKVNFRGIKLFLIYHYLFLYTKEGQYMYSDSGGQNYQAENSKPISDSFNRDVIFQHKKNADAEGKKILTFLEDNQDRFPMYKINETDSKVAERFDFKVIGNSYNRGNIIQ